MSDVDRPPTMIFLHVPKTAGLTLRNVIRRQHPPTQIFLAHFPPDERTEYIRFLRGEIPAPKPLVGGPNQRFLELVRALPADRRDALRVVMGHIWFGIHEALPQSSTYVTVLRDPVERTLSMYHHRATRHGLGLSLEEYIRSSRDLQLDNHQVRRIAATSGHDVRFQPLSPEMYDLAVDRLDRHFSVVGLTERFDLTLLALARTFRWRRLGYVAHNISSGRPRAETLDRDTRRMLEAHLEYDRALHRRAQGRFPVLLDQLGIDPERSVAIIRRRKAVYGRARPAYDATRAFVSRATGRRIGPALRRALARR